MAVSATFFFPKVVVIHLDIAGHMRDDMAVINCRIRSCKYARRQPNKVTQNIDFIIYIHYICLRKGIRIICKLIRIITGRRI